VRWILVVALAGCSSESNDVTGPFSGQTKTFYVDAIEVPADSTQAMAVAADLDGDGAAENKFGGATAVLSVTNDLSHDGADMIASGAIASVIEIQADDMTSDSSVGVTFDGGTVFGGQIVDGAFTSNRAQNTQHPGTAKLHLPVFTNTSPVTLDVTGELVLVPDGDGFRVMIRGRVDGTAARNAAFAGVVEMFQTEPQRHLVFMRTLDTDHDGLVSDTELGDSVIGLLLSPDLGEDISLAVALHVSPMPVMRTPTDHCRDRIKDVDETDVDCGGSCQRCWDGKACTAPTDCQSESCNGTCAAASCSDGVRDGFESDVDCGATCDKCAAGRVCAGDADCASNNCDNTVSALGHCS
jgi:hypothetical protein